MRPLYALKVRLFSVFTGITQCLKTGILRSSLLIGIVLFAAHASHAQDYARLTLQQYSNLQDVRLGFSNLDATYSMAGDRRKLFVEVYMQVTDSIEELIKNGEIKNGPWLESLIVDFANDYRDAVCRFEIGKNIWVPAPWVYDFQQAKSGRIGLQTQLLLAMSAHILYDLPRAIAKAPGDIQNYRDDYFKLNSMFLKILPTLQQKLYQQSNCSTAYTNDRVEKLKTKVVLELVKLMRRFAWQKSVELSALHNEKDREVFRAKLERFSLKFSSIVIKLDPILSTKPGKVIPYDLADFERTMIMIHSVDILF